MIAATMLLKQSSSNISFFHTRKKYPAFNFVRVLYSSWIYSFDSRAFSLILKARLNAKLSKT